MCGADTLSAAFEVVFSAVISSEVEAFSGRLSSLPVISSFRAHRYRATISIVKRTNAVFLLFLLFYQPLQSQQESPVYSKDFFQQAVATTDALDVAYKSALNHDPDAVYARLSQDAERSLISLQTKARSTRDKKFLRLLYAASTMTNFMHLKGNSDPDGFRQVAAIAAQCTIEAKLKVERDSVVDKLPKNFMPDQCLRKADTYARSIESGASK